MPPRRAGALAPLALLALTALGPPARAQDEPKRTPADQVAAIENEYNAALRAFSDKYQAAKSDDERTKVVASSYPKPETFAPRMLAIAKAHPDDPAAFAALSWIARQGFASDEPASKEAMALIAARYAEDPRIAEILPVFAYRPGDHVPLLERVIEKNPDRSARGVACLTLADVLKERSELARRLRDDAELRARYEQYAGKAEADRLASANPDALEARAVALYERVRDEFADVPGSRGPLGERAGRVLFEIAHLGVGKPAPEIEGEDIDGVTFKLSDYRGKVVLLDFWGDW